MPEDVMTISESDDDRPLINLIGLSIKKPNDEKENRVHLEMAAFTFALRSVQYQVSRRHRWCRHYRLIDGDSEVAGCGKIFVIHKRKRLGKKPPVITPPSPSTRVSTKSSNKRGPANVKRAHRKSTILTHTYLGNTDIGCTNDEEATVIVSSLTKVTSRLMRDGNLTATGEEEIFTMIRKPVAGKKLRGSGGCTVVG